MSRVDDGEATSNSLRAEDARARRYEEAVRARTPEQRRAHERFSTLFRAYRAAWEAYVDAGKPAGKTPIRPTYPSEEDCACGTCPRGMR
jgi:hypothetical protein